MTCYAVGGRVAGVVLLLLSGCSLSILPCGSQPLPAASSPDLLVPGGTAALLTAAGVQVPVEPARAVLVLTRQLHGPFAPLTGTNALDPVRAALATAAGRRRDAERIPGLLPVATWGEAVFGQAVAEANLLARILSDERASFLYCGLFALDEETLAFFVSHPGLLRTVHRNAAASFAAYSGGLRVRGGRLQVPGGVPAGAAWEQALKASLADPARFVERLLEQDGGRLAALFEALGRLDAPHLSFALGPAGAGLPALIESARRFDSAVQLPFVSWSEVDVAFLLEHVRVTGDGRLAPPRGRWFWEAAFSGEAAAGGPTAEEVTASWLLDRFAATPRALRRIRLDALLFIQRRFAAHFATGVRGAGDENSWLDAAGAFGSAQTLLLTLEQMGFVDPVDFREAVRAAKALTTGFDPSRASCRVAVFQGVISALAQCERVGSLERAATQGLTWDMFRAAEGSPEEYGQSVLAGIQRLLDRLSPSPSPSGEEERLLDGVAGVDVARPRPVLEWEGRRYVVDPARAERARLAELRGRQGGRTLDVAFTLRRAISELLDVEASPGRVREAAASVLAIARGARDGGEEWLFGFRVQGMLDDMLEAARAALEAPARPRPASVQRRLAAGLEAVLADVLVGHVYALWLDPEAPLVSADSPGRRHDLGLRDAGEVGPWSVARVADIGPSLGLRGSLLCLDRGLARQALRSTMVGLPPRPPTLRPEDARGLAESVAALNPFRLAGTSLLAGALRRGRAQVAAAMGQPEELDALLAAAGVDGTRRRLARLAAGRGLPGILDQVSLSEVLALGQQVGPPVPEAVLRDWGVAARLVDGSLGQWMPPRLAWRERAGRPGIGLISAHAADLQLRVAEWLAELRLPAMLARGVLSLATWDLAMTVQVANGDDWLPVIRAAQGLSRDRFEDYVSALSAGGPLVRVAPEKQEAP